MAISSKRARCAPLTAMIMASVAGGALAFVAVACSNDDSALVDSKPRDDAGATTAHDANTADVTADATTEASFDAARGADASDASDDGAQDGGDASSARLLEQITSGSDFTCLRRSSGKVLCWGLISSSPDKAPAVVSGLSDAVAIAAGSYFACALRATGEVVCWGGNDYGQLGNGTTTASSVPVSASGISNAVAISAGALHACALLASGEYACWGRNDQGQFGNGVSGVNKNLSPVTASGSHFKSLTAGLNSTCGITASNNVMCWGLTGYGALGDGVQHLSGDGYAKSEPTAVAGISDVVQLFGGGISGDIGGWCAMQSSGHVLCWGVNVHGEVGTGTATPSPLVPSAPLNLPEAVALPSAAGNAQSGMCAIRPSGQVSCWGPNIAGRFGDISNVDALVYVPTDLLDIADATDVSVGPSHSCILTKSGDVYCMGPNDQGQLGSGTISPSATPILTPTKVVGLVD